MRSDDSGVCSAGLMISVLPAASGAPHLPADEQQRMIERADARDDAERLAQRVVQHAGAIGIVPPLISVTRPAK